MFIASEYNWVGVIAGTWTRIAAGPLVTGLPVVWVEFIRAAPGLPNAPITFTVDGYSASPPWYTRTTGTGTAWAQAPGGFGGTRSGADASTGVPGGVPEFFALSPWIEFWVLTSRPCLAHVYGF